MRTETAKLRRALAVSERRLAIKARLFAAVRRREALRDRAAAVLAEAAARAARFANHDELTGLPNRRLLLDRFNQAAALTARHRKRVALLFLDLDGFKVVNDALGHVAGDVLLQQVAARLIGCIRASDTACRYGGDEFVILLPEIEDKSGLIVLADKIRFHLATPYVVADSTVKIATSVGMAVYPLDAQAFGDLVHAADVSMYRHKARYAVLPVMLPSKVDQVVPSMGMLDGGSIVRRHSSRRTRTMCDI